MGADPTTAGKRNPYELLQWNLERDPTDLLFADRYQVTIDVAFAVEE